MGSRVGVRVRVGIGIGSVGDDDDNNININNINSKRFTVHTQMCDCAYYPCVCRTYLLIRRRHAHG
jgi:hypothetical protein